jgi:hypothetical protein
MVCRCAVGATRIMPALTDASAANRARHGVAWRHANTVATSQNQNRARSGADLRSLHWPRAGSPHRLACETDFSRAQQLSPREQTSSMIATNEAQKA